MQSIISQWSPREGGEGESLLLLYAERQSGEEAMDSAHIGMEEELSHDGVFTASGISHCSSGIM
jgi:hypothetical protein